MLALRGYRKLQFRKITKTGKCELAFYAIKTATAKNFFKTITAWTRLAKSGADASG